MGFREDGYVVVPSVVPQALLDGVIDAIARCLSIDLSDSATWYQQDSWVVPIAQDAALWAVRQHPAVHAVFAELLGTEKLWVTVDRACFKPPTVDDSTYEYNDFIHFDRDPLNDEEILQGVVALTDTTAEQGGFQCVPQSLVEPGNWMRRDDFDSEELKFNDVGSLPVVQVPMNAGDLLVFTSKLAHGNGSNRAQLPRIAQYVTMFPEGDAAAADERVRDFENRLPPALFRKPTTQPEPGSPPTLTPLGRRLLGLDRW